jgi:hypothetical protein
VAIEESRTEAIRSEVVDSTNYEEFKPIRKVELKQAIKHTHKPKSPNSISIKPKDGRLKLSNIPECKTTVEERKKLLDEKSKEVQALMENSKKLEETVQQPQEVPTQQPPAASAPLPEAPAPVPASTPTPPIPDATPPLPSVPPSAVETPSPVSPDMKALEKDLEDLAVKSGQSNQTSSTKPAVPARASGKFETYTADNRPMPIPMPPPQPDN